MSIEELKRPERIDEDRIEKLKELFPEAFGDGKLNIEVLKDEVGDLVEENTEEFFGLQWIGKKEARKLASYPPQGTLKFLEGQGVNEKDTNNALIEGDNLEVLKVLQKSYTNKIKCIYIDPPYNTGKDFVYKDDYKDPIEKYLQKTGQADEDGLLTSNPKTGGRFHANWLSMMYPRLKLARYLLRNDGVIFISIDDNELDNLKLICDEIFGAENFIARIIHKNNSNKNQAKLMGISTEYILCYAKDLSQFKDVEWRVEKKGAGDIHRTFLTLKEQGLQLEEIESEIKEMYKRPKYSHLSRWNKVDENGVFKDADLSREGGPKNYTIDNPETGEPCVIPNRGWGKSYEELLRLQKEGLIWYGNPNTPPGLKDYLTIGDLSVPDNFWYFDNSTDTRFIKSIFGTLDFENPKPLEMIKQIVSMVTNKDDIILDFFAGSGTTGHAVLAVNKEDNGNRKFILVQIPEPTRNDSFSTIAEVTKERLRKAIQQLNEEDENINTLDRGFANYCLDASNIRKWRTNKFNNLDMFDREVDLFIANSIVEGTKKEDLIIELMLSQSFPLDSKISNQQVGSNHLTIVKHEQIPEPLIVCIDEKIIYETQSMLRSNFSKATIICLDNALSNEQKVLLSETMNVKTI
ncbi:site-specific DNA-methyltransferase [Alkalihalobacterium bogoriense]|uniref:site-specific DNA-methyltransferase n=1 Tax=Alkalihalobacterium bogoriense TaxID=246272 RepID=UPI00047D5110|nr:site-specific DNA-methyltransferase [Alkalihalobacterium bogoriense]